MEREWMAAELDAGRSIEAIAREVGRVPSTVAYWVNRHGLKSRYVAKHAARGRRHHVSSSNRWSNAACPCDRSRASSIAARPPSVIGFAATTLGRGQPATRRVVGKPALNSCANVPSTAGRFRCIGAATRYRCAQCAVEAVSNRRRRMKEILVREAGGA
jgi:hypothetical protein